MERERERSSEVLFIVLFKVDYHIMQGTGDNLEITCSVCVRCISFLEPLSLSQLLCPDYVDATLCRLLEQCSFSLVGVFSLVFITFLKCVCIITLRSVMFSSC